MCSVETDQLLTSLSGSTLFSIEFRSGFILFLKEFNYTCILFKHSECLFSKCFVHYLYPFFRTSKTFCGHAS